MNPAIYLLLALLLLLFSYLVFRRIVRHSYRINGQLSSTASFMQLLVFAAYFGFPFLFNPSEWAWFWQYSGQNMPILHYGGLLLICLGFITSFGTMGWFGLGKAFGLSPEGLTRTGPYKISRNPQIIGGYLLVLGTFMQWPSLYALGWVLIYVAIGHWMITTEEEHLAQIFGDEYIKYCSEVPRYLVPNRRTLQTSS